MNSEYRKKHLSIAQQKETLLQNLEFGEYNLAYFCSSWDARCLNITSFKLVANSTILTKLTFRDSIGLRDTADTKLSSFLSGYDLCEIPQEEDEPLSEVLAKLCGFASRAYAEATEPPCVLVDMTGFPRYLSLGLIAYLVKSNLARQVDVFYSEADYGEEQEEESVLFTEGKWEAIPINLLEGEYSPSKRTYLLVSTGFEGKKTLRAVHEREPDRVSVLMPVPGFTPEMEQRMEYENRKLLDYYKVPSKQIVTAGAADLVAAMKQLDKNLEDFSKENVYYLCCGTKPHSLALALRACLIEEAAVVYNKPESYRIRKIQHQGNYWLYRIQNRAVFA